MRRYFGGVLFLAAALIAGCPGGSSTGGGDGVTFHGEQQALAGYSYDTGYQPSTPPVQVRLVLSSGGALTADAQATGGGDSMTPTAGSGLFVMDAHLQIQALVKIDVAGLAKFEGAIPGAPDIDLAFGGQTAFEPFLIGGGSASVTGDVPETQLAEIPLGTIPGTLIIKALGTVTSEFTGVCATARGGVGQYTGSTATGGTVTLRPSVVLEIPFVGSKTYDIPEIPVTIAPTVAAMDLGTKSLADGTDVAGPGPCGDGTADGGVVGDGGAPDGGSGSCRLSCPGCCQGNVCQGGNEANACGTGGQECASCHGTTPYCVDSVCTAGSSCAVTCAGCCSGETCYGGTTIGACGEGGSACQQCTGSDQCVAGECRGSGNCASTCAGCCSGETCYDGDLDGACGSGGASCLACPTHYVCEAASRACKLDPASLWDVYAVDAQLPATDGNGDAWDPFGGAPDAYVQISTYVGGAKHLSEKSTTKDDTFTPVWNERVLSGVTANEILTGGLGFTIYDEDPTSYNDYMDSCSGVVPLADFDGQPHAACMGLIPLRYKIMPH